MISTKPTIDDILAGLKKVTKTSNGWSACCPSHDDRNPSLSITQETDGTIAFKCQTGCSQDAVRKALGVEWSDLFPAKNQNYTSPRKVSSKVKSQENHKTYNTADDAVATLERWNGKRTSSWDYYDKANNHIGVVVRFDPPNIPKFYKQVSKNGQGWIASGMPQPRPLYRLSELANARRVYITEGEKCSDLVWSLGLTSTTSSQGSLSAHLTDWSPLADKEVIILPDNNKAGQNYASAVIRILMKLNPAPIVKNVNLIGLQLDEDIEQWINNHDSIETDDLRRRLEAIADAAEPIQLDNLNLSDTPVLLQLDSVQPQQVRWLWPGRIPLGKLTLLAGDPGLGKSFICLDIMARLSKGTSWPDDLQADNCPGSTILLSAEDDAADTIVPRLGVADADLSRIVMLQSVRHRDPDTDQELPGSFCLTRDIPALEQAIKQTPDCKLIVIDPITAYLGRTDSHKNAEVRGILVPLSELAAKYGVVVVAVTHLRKSDGAAMYRAMGSLAFVAAARAVWAVVRDKEIPTRRLLLPVKMNLTPEAVGLAFSIIESNKPNIGVVAWESNPVNLSIDEALAVPATKPGPEAADRREAAEFLLDLLADGPMPTTEIKREVGKAGLSWRTVRRAKDELTIRVTRQKFGTTGSWVWSLSRGKN